MPKVIGIGAINIDFKISNERNQNNNFERIEVLGVHASDVEEKLNEAIYSGKQVRASLGGAALWTIKTLGLIDPSIQYSYVGVYGKDRKFEKLVGYIEEEMSLTRSKLRDEHFFFTDEGAPGRGVDDVSQNRLEICPYVNDMLAEKIREKEEQLKTDQNTEPFINYLAEAQWIHFSSLCRIEDFESILYQIEKAKEKNPELKLSVDIGYDYTVKQSLEFHTRIFKTADVIVLTQKEAENIACNRRHLKQTKELLDWVEFTKEFRGYLDALGATGDKAVYIMNNITHYGVISYGSHSFSHEYDVLYPLDEKAQDARGSGSTFTAAIIANHFKPETHNSVDCIKFAAYMAIIRKKSGAAFISELGRAVGEYRQKDGEVDHLHIVEDPIRSIFFSFSSRDCKISDKLYELLIDLGLKETDIFYSNNPDEIAPATSFVKEIKEEISSKPLFLVLNSENYKNSQMCIIELGAAWIVGSKIFPLLSPVLPGYKPLPTIISEINGCDLYVESRVLWLVNSLRKFVGYPSLGDKLDEIDALSKLRIEKFASENKL